MGHYEFRLGQKFIVLSAYITNLEKSRSNDLGQEKEASSSKKSRWQVKIKLRVEINEGEKKKTTQRINENQLGSLGK